MKIQRFSLPAVFQRNVNRRLHLIVLASIGLAMALGVSLAADNCDFSDYKPLRIVTEGKTTKQSVVPEYPSEAMKHQISGTVTVRVVFDANGIVQKACPITGHMTLRDAAERAALKTLFEPVLINNIAVPYVEQQIVFNFVLPKDTYPATPETAGQYAAGIAGRVTTSDGSIVAGAKVQVSQGKRNLAIKTVTDSKGEYWLELTPGTYDISVDWPSWKLAKRKNIKVEQNGKSTVDFVLQPGKLIVTDQNHP